MSSYLVRFDEDEAVFKRLLAERLLGGALAVGFAYWIGFVLFPDYKGRTVDGGVSVGAVDGRVSIQNVLLFIAVFLFFSFCAGPNDMTFDFRRRRWRFKGGYPMLSWRKGGDVAEICYIAVVSRKGYSLVTKGSDPNSLGTMFTLCSTRSEAQALAEKLGSRLGVPVKAGSG